MLITAMLASTLIACRPSRQDQTAANAEDTGQYEVLAKNQPEPRVYEFRVRVANLDESKEIARDIVHQTASQSPLKVRIQVLGPGDADNANPRETIKWPEELDYRVQ